MERPILYSARHCPFSTRARLALIRAGRQCELREIDLSDKPPVLAELSEKNTVPVLQLRGEVIDDSLAIMHWALDDRDELGLWPDNTVLQQAIRNLIATMEGPFATAAFRYRFHQRYPRRSQLDYRQEAEVFLAQLEARLARGGSLVGQSETLADLAVLPFVNNFARVEPEWFEQSPYAAIRSWLERYRSSALFETCMHKHPLWHADAEPVWLLGTDPAAASA